MNWTREDLAWAAGLFEGEGCISAGRQDSYILQLVSTDEDVVRRFYRVIELGTISGPFIPNGNVKYKPAWKWCCTNQYEMLAVLVALWPWLGERRQEKAREAIICFYSRPRQFYRRRKARPT